MKLIPRTLLGRTAFVIAALIIITQLVAITLFRAYNRGPLLQEMAGLVSGQLRIISAALETLPPEERIDFLDLLEESQGIRVIADTEGKLPSNVPQSAQLQDFAEYLKGELGDGTEFFVQSSGGVALWVRLKISNEQYWVSIPRKQIERAPPWLWFGWMGFSAVLVLAGAYLLVRRVNRPLRELAQAARQLGEGKSPPPLIETGPTEIRDMSRAFNQMAEDIKQHNEERALLLAGVPTTCARRFPACAWAWTSPTRISTRICVPAWSRTLMRSTGSSTSFWSSPAPRRMKPPSSWN